MNEFRRRALKPEEEQQNQQEHDIGEEDIYVDGAREKYMQRPLELEGVLYAEYNCQ